MLQPVFTVRTTWSQQEDNFMQPNSDSKLYETLNIIALRQRSYNFEPQ